MGKIFNQDSYPYFGTQDHCCYEPDSSQRYDGEDGYYQFKQGSEIIDYETYYKQQEQDLENQINFNSAQGDLDSDSQFLTAVKGQDLNKKTSPDMDKLMKVKNFRRPVKQNEIKKEKKKKSSGLTVQGKNNGKNICRALKSFIKGNFDEKERQQEPLKRFLALKQKDCGKYRLEAFLKTKKGNSLGRMFFGNYQWAREFYEKNKIEVGSQLQHNDYWYRFVQQNQI